jgi:hypothetical protein
MSAAARMRKYRARKRLIRTLTEANRAGVNVALAYEDWKRTLIAAQTTAAPTRAIDLCGYDAKERPED